MKFPISNSNNENSTIPNNKRKLNVVVVSIIFFAVLVLVIHEIFVADDFHLLVNLQQHSPSEKSILDIPPSSKLSTKPRTTKKIVTAAVTTDDEGEDETSASTTSTSTSTIISPSSTKFKKIKVSSEHPLTETQTSTPRQETVVVEEVVDIENYEGPLTNKKSPSSENYGNNDNDNDSNGLDYDVQTNISEYAADIFPAHPNLARDTYRSSVRTKKVGENHTVRIYPPMRHYSRMVAVDAIGPDLAFLPNATLIQCLRWCDRLHRCNYVVRNSSFVHQQQQQQNSSHVSREMFNGHGACWLKLAVILNTYPNFDRETWVITRAPQPKIAIGLLSSPKFLSTRLLPALATWLKEEDVVVILENRTDAKDEVRRIFGRKASRGIPCDRIFNKHGLHQNEAELLRSATTTGPGTSASSSTSRIMFLFENEDPTSIPGAWKNMVLYKKLPFAYKAMMRGANNEYNHLSQSRRQRYRQYVPSSSSSSPSTSPSSPHAASSSSSSFSGLKPKQDTEEPDWYLIVDDDSFIIMRNLRFLLSVSLPYEPSYSGLVMAAADFTKGAQFVQGGAGIVLSQDTFIKTLPKFGCCDSLCRQLYGDFRSGCCFVQAAKISATMHKGFYPYSPWDNVGTDMRKRYGYPMFPVSFHRLRETPMITKFQNHIDEFLATAKKDRGNTRFAGSRYRMAPGVDNRYMYLRLIEEGHFNHHQSNNNTHNNSKNNSSSQVGRVPMNRRIWSYVDDLVQQRMLKNLAPWHANRPQVQPFVPILEITITSASNATFENDSNHHQPRQEQTQDAKIQQRQILDKMEREALDGAN